MGHNFRTWEAIRAQERRDQPVMSQAIWCDRGQHAFSSNDDERQNFTQTRTVKVSGNPAENRQQVTTTVDICGPCWNTDNPFEPSAKDPVRELEAESDSYTKGYDAGIEHALRTQGTGGNTNWNSGSGGSSNVQGGSGATAHYPDV